MEASENKITYKNSNSDKNTNKPNNSTSENKGNKKPLRRLSLPFQRFLHAESFSGFLLLFFTIIALIWANSAFSESYFNLWNSEITIGFKEFLFSRDLHFVINDILMAVFFFVVGLEIKRELIAGELSSFRLAALPILAALGGMLFPALFYTVFNLGKAGQAGWGIPTATDIAFAIGILSLLGKRVPIGLKVFLTALAIADDMGAIVVIALFYTTNFSLIWLLMGLVVFGLLLLANKLNIYSTYVYITLGTLLWIALYNAGIHPTIAGVLTAVAIPALNRIKGDEMEMSVKNYLLEFASYFRSDKHPLANQKEQEGIYAIEKASRQAQTPLKRLEDKLHPWVAYFIMPLFALANAGVVLKGDVAGSFSNSITLGIVLGLVLGKPVGITLLSFLAVKLGLADLPEGGSWKRIIGVGMLAGIGFTMSIFITGLAFTDSALIDLSKIGILSASAIAGIGGYILLRSTKSVS
ncbi:MAG TPA: Na+/H+ antiporter NhaA [Ignavibacteriales bacterium]|nr:Na+/H+ antiporter NhaA [Ignavibacteriales bacterium]